jgi:hypothetical protein
MTFAENAIMGNTYCVVASNKISNAFSANIAYVEIFSEEIFSQYSLQKCVVKYVDANFRKLWMYPVFERKRFENWIHLRP